MDTDSLVIQIRGLDFYKDISEDVETRYHTSNYEDKRRYRPVPVRKSKKSIELMKYEISGKIITKFEAVRPRIYADNIQKDEHENKNKDFKNSKKSKRKTQSTFCKKQQNCNA